METTGGTSTRAAETTPSLNLGAPSRNGNDVRNRPGSPLALASQKKRLKPTADTTGTTTRAALPPHLVHSSGVQDAASTSSHSAAHPPPLSSPPRANLNRNPKDGTGGSTVAKGKTTETTERARANNKEETHARTAMMAHEIAVAKLRLFLARSMLQTVRSSPNGGFGTPVGYVIEAMGKEFGEGTVWDLLGTSSPNALILNTCGDIVELQPLRVQDLTKNGCVPSTQFRRDSANIEAKIRKECFETVAQLETEMRDLTSQTSSRKEPDLCQNEEEMEESPALVESQHQNPNASALPRNNSSQFRLFLQIPAGLQLSMTCGVCEKGMLTEKMLCEMVKLLLEETMKDVMTDAVAFPNVSQFSERFEKKHGIQLDPKVAGYESVLDMLRGMKLDSLISFSEFEGTVYLVPANQAYNKHFKEITGHDSRPFEEIPSGKPAAPIPERRALTPPTALATASMPAIPTIHVQKPVEVPPPPPPPLEERGHPVSAAGHLESVYVPCLPSEVQERPPLSLEEACRASNRQGHFSQPPVLHVDVFDEFDAEILNKLKMLFEQTICRDQNPICLNRLPLLFMRHCGSVLDYQKYGYINLTDVVSLLSDIVKVVDTANGKYIVPVDKPFRKPGVLNSVMAVPQRQALEEETRLIASQAGTAIRMSEAPVWTTPSSIIDTVIWPPGGQLSVLPDRLAYGQHGMPIPPQLSPPQPPLPAHLPYFTGKGVVFGSVSQQEQALFRPHFST